MCDGDPAAAAEAVLQAVREVGPENAWGGKLAASIGVGLVGASGIAPADVLAGADGACYAAKARGRNHRQLQAELPLNPGMTAAQLACDLDQGQH